jgi:ankyrin repeat protein
MDGTNVQRLAEAVRDGDLPAVTAILDARPELVAMDMAENDEHQALHHAVLHRRPEIVRALMQRGADPRKGIWPHRDATSALTIAGERDYTEIVEIIRQEEARRSPVAVPLDSSVERQLTRAYQQDDESAFLGILESRPTLVHAADPASGMTALHLASVCLWERTAVWLIGHGARIDAADSSGRTPIDLLGSQSELSSAAARERAAAIAGHLLAAGAEPNARSAVTTGRVDILRARHARGDLGRERGLVTHAVRSQQPGSVAVLLELGLDPDERGRVENVEEVVQSWGEPLRACAISGDVAMAKLLLDHGADPNTSVYASSSAMYEAFARQDRDMIALLESHGGVVTPTGAGYLGMLERARQLLEDEAAGLLPAGTVGPDGVAAALLEGAADSGHVEIVRLAVDRLDWPRGDSRWTWLAMRPFGRHSTDTRDRFVECFRLIVDRSGGDLEARFGRTLLHDVAANWPRTSPMGAVERVTFAGMLLDRGARLDRRDEILKSTPLGWACRWGHIELVQLLLDRGADPRETAAEPWAAPQAWARRIARTDILSVLDSATA